MNISTIIVNCTFNFPRGLKNASRLLLILLIPTLALQNKVSAQSYVTAVGLRAGNVLGLTVAQRIAKHSTLEGLMGQQLTRKTSFASLMIRQHQNLLIGRGLNLYLGAGGHWDWKKDSMRFQNDIGVALIAGAEITIGHLNASWDFRPIIFFGEREQNFFPETAFSFRYIFFKKDPFRKKKKPFWENWFRKK